MALSVTRHLAELYMAQHRPSEAEALLREPIAVLRGAASSDRAALALAYNDLAVASYMQGRQREAETLLRQALALLEAEYGPDHPMLTSSLEPLAALLVVRHRYAEAQAPAERAWRLLQSTSMAIGPADRANAIDVLSEVYAHTGRAAEAEAYAAQAVALAESIYGPQHLFLGIYLECYADVLKQADHKKPPRCATARRR